MSRSGPIVCGASVVDVTTAPVQPQVMEVARGLIGGVTVVGKNCRRLRKSGWV